MFIGMSLILFLQETSAYNVCILEGKESLKENVRLCMGREGGFVTLPASSLCVHIIISLCWGNINTCFNYATSYLNDFIRLSKYTIFSLVFLCHKTIRYYDGSLHPQIPLLQSQYSIFLISLRVWLLNYLKYLHICYSKSHLLSKCEQAHV